MKVSKQELHLLIDLAKLESMPGTTIINNDGTAYKHIFRSLYLTTKYKNPRYQTNNFLVLTRTIREDFGFKEVEYKDVAFFKNPIKSKVQLNKFFKKQVKVHGYSEDQAELHMKQRISNAQEQFK